MGAGERGRSGDPLVPQVQQVAGPWSSGRGASGLERIIARSGSVSPGRRRLGCKATTTARADSKRSSWESPQAELISTRVTSSGWIRLRDARQGRAIAFCPCFQTAGVRNCLKQSPRVRTFRRCFRRFLAEAINRSSMKGCGDELPFHAEERLFIQDQFLIDFLSALGGMPSLGAAEGRHGKRHGGFHAHPTLRVVRACHTIPTVVHWPITIRTAGQPNRTAPSCAVREVSSGINRRAGGESFGIRRCG